MRCKQISNRYYRPLCRIATLACIGSITMNVLLLCNNYKHEKVNLELKSKINHLEDSMAYNERIKQIEFRKLNLDELFERLSIKTPLNQ